jgi:hypothetical protein
MLALPEYMSDDEEAKASSSLLLGGGDAPPQGLGSSEKEADCYEDDDPNRRWRGGKASEKISEKTDGDTSDSMDDDEEEAEAELKGLESRGGGGRGGSAFL